jgi:ankyrin repeat protein
LALAAQQGKRDMIVLLIAAHGDVNAQSEARMPPLIAAILSRDAQTVRLLLDNKADPAIRFHGKSAADYARSTGDAALLNLVVRIAS